MAKSKLTNKQLILLIVVGLIIISTQGEKKEAGETMAREFSVSSIEPGETFTVKYKVLGFAVDPFFFSIKDTITGGCTVFGNPEIVTTLTSPQPETGAITVQAPSSGSCQFNGDWKSGSDAAVSFTPATVSISAITCSTNSDCSDLDTECITGICSSGSCTTQFATDGISCTGGTCQSGVCTGSDQCSTLGGTCCESSEVCVGGTIETASNCATCCSGTCEPPTQTCAELSGTVCSSSQTCSGGTLVVTQDTARCCINEGVCTTPSSNDCEAWEQTSDKGCELAGWVYLVGGFVGLMVLLRTL